MATTEETHMLRDIRELEGDEYAAELARRWGGLLSYRYIGAKSSSMNVNVTDTSIALRHDMRNGSGGLLIAPLAIASPESGGWSDLDVVPNPVIHSCQILDPGADVQRLQVLSETLKQGRQMGYSRSRIVDADNPSRVLALTEGQAVSLGVPPEGIEKFDPEPIIVEDSPDLPPLWQVFGGGKRDDGHWALKELVVELGSPDGALHIGPQQVVMETAAMEMAAHAAGTPLQAVSSHVMFLARGKVGPFRIDATPFVGPDGMVGARTMLHDEGAGERAVSTGSYLFRSVS
jgi:hypothetical protein